MALPAPGWEAIGTRSPTTPTTYAYPCLPLRRPPQSLLYCRPAPASATTQLFPAPTIRTYSYTATTTPASAAPRLPT
eukprot:scaffold17333_cov152-Isochrysis_galbana.AAC.2